MAKATSEAGKGVAEIEGDLFGEDPPILKHYYHQMLLIRRF